VLNTQETVRRKIHAIGVRCTMKDLQCQMYHDGVQCTGTLVYLDRYSTCLGTVEGLNGNQIAEIFRCSVCKELIVRPYRWHVAGEQDKHELRDFISGKNGMNYSVLLTEDELLLLDGHASERVQKMIEFIKACTEY